jgi:hypothetical protein
MACLAVAVIASHMPGFQNDSVMRSKILTARELITDFPRYDGWADDDPWSGILPAASALPLIPVTRWLTGYHTHHILLSETSLRRNSILSDRAKSSLPLADSLLTFHI